MKINNADLIKIKNGNSTVKLEIDLPVLLDMFNILSNNDRKEILRTFLTQLRNNEYFNDNDVSKWSSNFKLK